MSQILPIIHSFSGITSIQPPALLWVEPSAESGKARSARFHSALKEPPVCGGGKQATRCSFIVRSAGMCGKDREFWKPEVVLCLPGLQERRPRGANA